jgi:hypothetical protein
MQPAHAYNLNSLERRDKSTALEDGTQGQLGQKLVPDPILKTSQVW